jgi:TetR/AcrR family transcriptional regulator
MTKKTTVTAQPSLRAAKNQTRPKKESASAGARRAGRPKNTRSNLREELLQTALELFAAKGIAATRLRDLATAAGVTPAMLHYYFNDKQQLVQEVVDEKIFSALSGMGSRLSTDGDCWTLIISFIDQMHAMILQHPWMPQLWVREFLTDGGVLRELLLKRVAPMIPHRLAQAFHTAKINGELRDEIDPRFLAVNLLGFTMFTAASAPIWQAELNAADMNFERQKQHLLALLDSGIKRRK